MPRTGAAAGEGVGIVRNLQVVADKDNNTLLIVATPAEYGVIEQALKKLDVPQRQVLMEVTMAEVKLTDNLSGGVEALFKNLAPSGNGSAGSFNVTPAFNPAGSGTSGLGVPSGANFAYIISSAKYPGGIRAVLNLMDSYGNTKVRRSTTRRRRSRSATGFPCARRRFSPAPRTGPCRRRRSTSTPARCCR
jgi:general secretion pathway protein D